MRPPGIVAVDVGADAGFGVLERGIFLDIDLFVLDGAPQTFGEDVVVVTAASVHADLDTRSKQPGCERLAGELAALVAVEDERRCQGYTIPP